MSHDDGTVSAALAFTGERFVPGAKGEIWIEHWHRYYFAARFTRGKRVLDVACGEGYGAALLAREAEHVTGVDLSSAAIAHARRHYGGEARVEFLQGSCTRLPVADASVDFAVSFETLEHIAEQEAFLDELARVLRPDGVLLLSCPNRHEYSDQRGYANEFHVKELYRDELAALVAKRFREMAWYGQRPSFFSLIAPEQAMSAAAQLIEVAEANPAETRADPASPLYFLVAASAARSSLEALPATVSVLADRDDWVRRDYEKVMKDAAEHQHRKVFLEGLVAERDALVAALQGQLGECSVARASAEAGVARRDATLAEREAALKARQTELAARNAAIADLQAEIVRRQGWLWWLKLPLKRLLGRL